jgi:hypothetical protein
MLGCARRGFHKKLVVTRYDELVFLHPVRCVGHVVYFGESGCDTSTFYFSCMGGPVWFP